jgi:Flp pilus assembly protein TadG
MSISDVVRTVREGARRGRRDERGAAAVELALVMPILVLILFGIIEFARAWNVRQTLTDAAREGARIAVVNASIVSTAQLTDSVTNVVQRAAQTAGLDISQLTITPTGINAAGGTARVQLQYVYTPIVGLVISAPFTMQTAAVMRNE